MQEEAKTHNDIVTFDFVEDYKKRMTLKTLVTMNWAVKTFQSRFFVKIDEDVVFNQRRFHQESNAVLEAKQKESSMVPPQVIFGRCFLDTGPDRRPKSKYYVSENTYPGSKYPNYTSGPFYVLTGAAIESVLQQVPFVPVPPMEDVAVSGTYRLASGQVDLECVDNWIGDRFRGRKGYRSFYKNFVGIHTMQLDAGHLEVIWRQLNGM